MNNNYYIAVRMLKEYLDKIPTLNTKVFARSAEKDLFKNSVYPLAHLNSSPTPWENRSVNLFTFELGVLDQRIIPDKSENDVWEGDSNIINTMATTYSIMNDFLSQLERGREDIIYEVVNISNLTPLYIVDTNGLDGWAVTFTIRLINHLDVC